MTAGSNTFCVHACSRHKPIPAFGEIEVIFVIVTSRVTIRSWIIIYSPVLHALRFITWKKAKERKSTLKTWQWQRCKIKEWETEERVSVIFLVPLSEFSKGGKGGGGGVVTRERIFIRGCLFQRTFAGTKITFWSLYWVFDKMDFRNFFLKYYF